MILTVTVSPEPILMTESLSFWSEALNSLKSLRVHMEAAAMGGNSSTTQQRGQRYSRHSYNSTAHQHWACTAQLHAHCHCPQQLHLELVKLARLLHFEAFER